MVGVVRPSLSWCYHLRMIALSRVGGVVWPTWANLFSILRLITNTATQIGVAFQVVRPVLMHLIQIYGLSLNFVDRDLFFTGDQFWNSLFSTR